MPFLIVLSAVLLVVVVFALQNSQAVTVRFLYWQVQSSLAIVIIAATAAGVLIAGLFGSARRPWRRGRGRAATAGRLAGGLIDRNTTARRRRVARQPVAGTIENRSYLDSPASR